MAEYYFWEKKSSMNIIAAGQTRIFTIDINDDYSRICACEIDDDDYGFSVELLNKHYFEFIRRIFV